MESITIIVWYLQQFSGIRQSKYQQQLSIKKIKIELIIIYNYNNLYFNKSYVQNGKSIERAKILRIKISLLETDIKTKIFNLEDAGESKYKKHFISRTLA